MINVLKIKLKLKSFFYIHYNGYQVTNLTQNLIHISGAIFTGNEMHGNIILSKHQKQVSWATAAVIMHSGYRM